MQEYKATDYTMKNNYGLPSSYKASIETSPAGKDY